jgi:hypothetical protein
VRKNAKEKLIKYDLDVEDIGCVDEDFLGNETTQITVRGYGSSLDCGLVMLVDRAS